MADYHDTFQGCKAVFFVAIHVGLNFADVATDVEVAFDEGANGIFLIKDYNTLATDDDVKDAYRFARRKHPLKWIGVNYLDHTALDAVGILSDDVSGVWLDRVHVITDAGYLKQVRTHQKALRPRTLLFPSIAFKYQDPVSDYGKVTKLASKHSDTIVTSGSGTGVAADIGKVRIMRKNTKLPLGLASGVSSENVESFLDVGVDFFIVNTSISNATGRLDPILVRALRKKIS